MSDLVEADQSNLPSKKNRKRSATTSQTPTEDL